MFAMPIAAAVIYGIALVHYKWALARTNLDTKTFLATHFVVLFLVAAGAAARWGELSTPIFSNARYLLLFAILVVFGLVHNYFLARGLKRESLHEYEIIDLLVPIFTVLLAALAFADEREPLSLILALLGTSVFLLTHLRHHHIKLKQADRWLMYAVFVMALERIVVKPLLTLADPSVLYALRTGWIALFLVLLFRPRFGSIPLREWGQLLLNGLLGVTAMILIWTSIGRLGVVVTELYLLIAPMVMAMISVAVFKERWTAGQIVAFGVILFCITLVNLTG